MDSEDEELEVDPGVPWNHGDDFTQEELEQKKLKRMDQKVLHRIRNDAMQPEREHESDSSDDDFWWIFSDDPGRWHFYIQRMTSCASAMPVPCLETRRPKAARAKRAAEPDARQTSRTPASHLFCTGSGESQRRYWRECRVSTNNFRRWKRLRKHLGICKFSKGLVNCNSVWIWFPPKIVFFWLVTMGTLIDSRKANTNIHTNSMYSFALPNCWDRALVFFQDPVNTDDDDDDDGCCHQLVVSMMFFPYWGARPAATHEVLLPCVGNLRLPKVQCQCHNTPSAETCAIVLKNAH